MIRKLALVTSSVLLALAAGLALLWWLIFVRAFPFPTEGKALLFFAAVFLVQLVSLLLLGQLLARAWEETHPGLAWLAVAGGFYLLFGNALYFFTPAIGGMVILPVLVLAITAKLVFEHKKAQDIQKVRGLSTERADPKD